jgi:hypothetical protein
VDSTTAVLFIESHRLANVLRPIGLALSPWTGAPPGKHPVCLDLWSVRGGQLKVTNVDQHQLAASTGAALGRVVGAYRRIAIESVSGAVRSLRDAAPGGSGDGNPLLRWSRASVGWFEGAARALEQAVREEDLPPEAELGARAARSLSEAVSSAVASYNELIAVVPNTLRSDRDGQLHAYVLGMASDGPMSILGDRMMACGYKKAFLPISRYGFARYRVADAGRRQVMQMTAREPRAAAWARVDHRLDAYRVVFSQPLLGHLGAGMFAVSYLDRFLDGDAVRFAPAAGRLEIGSFVKGLPAGTYEVERLSSRRPLGAFHARAVATAVTFPRHD